MQKRRDFLKATGASLLLSLMPGLACHQKNTQKPNIVLLMADDIGFSDIGCYGSEVETPNLDRLGENGVRFKQFYNMAKCNPTRSSLMTGLYQGDERAISFVSLLRDAGYNTIMSGKEHFDEWVPEQVYFKNTFDQSFTFWATTEYFVPPSGEFTRPFYLNGKELKASEIKMEQKPGYKTDFITDYALDWLDEIIEDDNPFFIMLPYHAAHYPLQARESEIKRYRGTYKKGWDKIRQERFERMKQIGILDKDTRLSPPSDNTNRFRGHPKGDEAHRKKISKYNPWNSLSEKEQDELDLEMAVYAAMIDRMDQNIGRVLNRLEKAGQIDNTLILFFTDNGACPFDSNVDFKIPPGGADSYRCQNTSWSNVGNTPFRLFKQNGHEGGCNTHCIAHWPNVIRENFITDQPGHVVDIFPTLMDVAGIEYPDIYKERKTIPLHGKSLLPIFKGQIREEPDYFISGFTERFRMFRQKNWKIVRENGEAWELYDLNQDPTELNDLAQALPEQLKNMIFDYETIMLQMNDE